MTTIQITQQILEAKDASLNGLGIKGFTKLRCLLLKKCAGLSKTDTVKRLTIFYTHGEELGLTPEARIAALGTIAYL